MGAEDKHRKRGEQGAVPDLAGEGALYSELGRLLRKPRGEEATRLVEAIVRRNLPVADTLARVREVDGRAGFKSRLPYLRPAASRDDRDDRRDPIDDSVAFNEEASRALAERGIYTPLVVRERRRGVRRAARRSGMIEFLFRDLRPLAQFARETGVLEVGLFPPRVRLARGVEAFFREHVRRSAVDLLPVLAYAEEHGWQWLTKFEYNLLLELKRLCERIATLDREPNRTGEHGFPAKLARLELSFLVCHHASGYPERIVAALELVLRNGARYDNVGAFADLARRLLLPRRQGPSLHAVVLALGALRARRLLEVDALVDRQRHGIINNYSFDCPRSVQRAIDTRLEALVAELKQLARQRASVEHVVRYLARTPAGEWDFGALFDFSAAHAPRLRFAWPPGEENALAFACVFAEAYGTAFRALLTGEFAALPPPGPPAPPAADPPAGTGNAPGGTPSGVPAGAAEAPGTGAPGTPAAPAAAVARVFEHGCFDGHFAELAYLAEKLDRLSKVDRHVVLSRERLAALLATALDEGPLRSKGELETVQELSRLATLARAVAETLARVLQGARPGDDRPLSPPDLRKSEYRLPHADWRLDGGPLAGHVVREALVQATSMAYAAALYLQDPPLCQLLTEQASVEAELRDVRNQLERLATPIRYEALRGL